MDKIKLSHRTKVSFSKPRFKVIGKKVICELVAELVGDARILALYNGPLEVRFKASTTCSAEDVFDEVKGKKIAQTKAEIKAYNYFKVRLNAICSYATEFTNLAYQLKRFEEHNKMHLYDDLFR